jgi:cell shape-determining protein MreC
MRSHSRNRSLGALWTATAVVVILYLLDILLGGALRAPVRSVYGYAHGIVRAVASWDVFTSRATLTAENAQLRAQIARMQAEQSAYTAYVDQDRSLKELSRYVTSEKDVTAPIISSVARSPYDTFVIGAGSQDGITLGSSVKGGGGFVIGTVSTVSGHQAVVTRTLAPDAELEAYVAGADIMITGTGTGNGRGTVPRGVTVKKGDTVTVPKLANAPIAVVGDVESTPTSPHQTVYIVLPVNLIADPYVVVTPAGRAE